MKIGFIGLGNMGGGMAANLARVGHEVRAFDLSKEALTRAKEKGCTPCTSIKEAVADAQIVVTMLPNGKIVDEVYSNEIIGHAPRSTTLIDCAMRPNVAAMKWWMRPCLAGLRRPMLARSPSWLAVRPALLSTPSQFWRRWAKL